MRSRIDLIDYDYLNKLSPEELDWLNKFTEEYVNAKLDPKPNKNLHNKKRLKKDCYDRNNARNSCILTRQKAGKKLRYMEDIKNKPSDYNEEQLVNVLDQRRYDSYKIVKESAIQEVQEKPKTLKLKTKS